jgi:nitric oxide reductase NorD protein
MSSTEGEGRSQKRPSLTGLAKDFGHVPAAKRRVALEMSAALAGVSLRASRAFVAAVPEAAKVLSVDDLRGWAELGRRLAMGSVDSAVRFFAAGAGSLSAVSAAARADLFEICARQMVLSSSVAVETFETVSDLARRTNDEWLFEKILKLASEIATRSAKHSAEFLQRTPAVAERLAEFGNEKRIAAEGLIRLAYEFANRTGGMTADLWSVVPAALKGINGSGAEILMDTASGFLEFGGSVTLHFIESGGAIIRISPEAFPMWHSLARKMGAHGNAVLIAFLRASPPVFSKLRTATSTRRARRSQVDLISQVLSLIAEIADRDTESALAAFRSSPAALDRVSLDQFGDWVKRGLDEASVASTKSRRSYFALETRGSNERLHKTRAGLPLDDVRTILRIYIEGLTGKEVDVASMSAMPQGSRIGDGKTIYLPVSVSEFGNEEMDFRLYKVLAAHGAGQIEFGTFERDTPELRAAYNALSTLHQASADQLDAFSLAGYIEDVQKGDPARPVDKSEVRSLPHNSDYKAVLAVFPEPPLARKIFGTMENARIDNQLRSAYRGLRKDLDLMKSLLRETRPYIFDIPAHRVPFELLFQITLCGGATEDARRFYGQVVSEIESVVESYLAIKDATVADSLMATSRVYSLFQNITAEQTQEADSDEAEEKGDLAYDDKDSAEAVTQNRLERERPRDARDISELFNAWNSLDDEGEPDDIRGSEVWTQAELPEQALETGDEAYSYDEWDRELSDYRVGWSRVIEKKVKKGDRNFVELARSRYRGVISSIRHQFQLMKPENLTRVNRELDGEDYDLNAVVDFVIDRKADGRQAENIYTKRLRKQRDVAVSILLDQSSSTARTITRNPLQPYTHPGRRIIEIEKEGLVLMSEALEAVGDVYSINGFTSEGRRNVKFYVVKDFSEKYSDEVERRIGGITFQNNTRLGAAIRHASAKLLIQDARTKLLIILTDGRPYDHDYGDARYAREDVREALTKAKVTGITPFCITVDRESETELRELYGDVGYTIIDDVLSLPERMPSIYRRLTS